MTLVTEHAEWSWRTMADDITTTLMLVGDTNVQNRDDPADAFKLILPTLRCADVLFGHLEGPLSLPSADPRVLDIPHKPLWRHSDPAMVQGFQAAGFAAMSCASNVTYPAKAARDTIATLEAAGIQPCGVGCNVREAHRPAIVERDGATFGLLSYTSVFWPVGHAAGENEPGVATLKAYTSYQPGRRALEMPGAPPIVVTIPDEQELKAMEEDVRRLRRQVDLVVVSCHWGVSSSHQVADYQRVIGRAAIRAGADIVFGHHPHVIQEIEVYHGRPIFYSMGNFAFDWAKMRGRNQEGLLVRCLVRNKRVVEVTFVPVRRNEDNLIRVLSPKDRQVQALIENVFTASSHNGTELRVEGTEVVVEGIVSSGVRN